MRVLVEQPKVKIVSDGVKVIKSGSVKVISEGVQGSSGTNAQNLKSMSVISPLATEDIVLFYTDAALTLRNIVFNVNEGSLDWNVGYSSMRDGVLTKIFTNDRTLADATESISSFDVVTIPANSFFRFITSDKVGSVIDAHLTILYLTA